MDFETRDIEYLHDRLCGVKVLSNLTLYEALAQMTRYTWDVHLVKLKDGRYRAVYDVYHELFEGDDEVEALYRMVMSFVEMDKLCYIQPMRKPDWILSCDWEEFWGKPNKPRIKYYEL